MIENAKGSQVGKSGVCSNHNWDNPLSPDLRKFNVLRDVINTQQAILWIVVCKKFEKVVNKIMFLSDIGQLADQEGS